MIAYIEGFTVKTSLPSALQARISKIIGMYRILLQILTYLTPNGRVKGRGGRCSHVEACRGCLIELFVGKERLST